MSHEEQNQLLSGIARPGFLKPDILAIKSSGFLREIKNFFGGDLFGMFGSGIYFNQEIIPEMDERSQKAHQRAFNIFRERFGITAERILVVDDNVGEGVIRHELIHDILFSHPLGKRDELRNYIDESGEVDKELRFDMNYVGERASSTGPRGRQEDIQEFACKFFAGQWGCTSHDGYEEKRTQSAIRVATNAPAKLKQMFFDMGLIWPQDTPKHQ